MPGYFMNGADIVDVDEDELIKNAGSLQNLQWLPVTSLTQPLKGIDG